MPNVRGKKFPYTAKGKADAAKARGSDLKRSPAKPATPQGARKRK